MADEIVLHDTDSAKRHARKPSDGLLIKKTEALKLEPKIKSKGLDVPKLWAEGRASRKSAAAFVVIGHVDHGKSTLMGRLLLDTGAVAQRDIDKYAALLIPHTFVSMLINARRYQKQATELNKSSFALAWVMDTGSEERERGITVDIAQHPFSTLTTDFTVLDAPGHRDFVPNMLAGASMADLAVLVVDANQLESGMKGQTREHILLAKACGLERVVVAVNKLDATTPTAWDENTFQSVRSGVQKLLTSVGFQDPNISFVPCSGLSGTNVVNPAPSTGPTAWVASTSGTILQQLESSPPTSPPEELVKAPLRLQITDVFRGSITNPISVSGRLAAGNVQIGDTVLTQPSGEKAIVKGIEISAEPREWAVAGELVTLHLSDIDPVHLRAGDVLCSVDKPVAIVRNFVAQVTAMEALLPQGVDVHVGRLHVPGSVAALISTVDANGEVVRKKPRVVKGGDTANVKVSLQEGAPLAVGDRIILRSGGSTIAAGQVDRTGS